MDSLSCEFDLPEISELLLSMGSFALKGREACYCMPSVERVDKPVLVNK